jgi:CheY-like chemotaxis protein
VNGSYLILLVEDSPDDVLLIERAFQKADLRHPLRSVTDGRKAIEYLDGVNDYSDRDAFPFPGLVILDLKMPVVGGFDVIRWMRSHAQAKLVPIIVLASSSLPADVNRAYELGANAFMVKPADHRALEQLLRTMGEFWLANEGPHPSWAATAATML